MSIVARRTFSIDWASSVCTASAPLASIMPSGEYIGIEFFSYGTDAG